MALCPVPTKSCEEAETEDRDRYGSLASSYLTLYRFDRPFFNKYYVIRRTGEGTFKIGNSLLPSIEQMLSVLREGDIVEPKNCGNS